MVLAKRVASFHLPQKVLSEVVKTRKNSSLETLCYIKTAPQAQLCETISHSSRSGYPPRTQAARDLTTIRHARASPAVPPETTAGAVHFSMMRDFLRSAPTVSEGCAPFASHALMAGALRFDCFLIGSYHPSSCW